MKFKIPEIGISERLKLRLIKENDWQDLFSYYSDEVCMQYTTLSQVRLWFPLEWPEPEIKWGLARPTGEMVMPGSLPRL